MSFLTAWEGEKLLRKNGLPIVSSELVRTKAEALRAADNIGYPIVMKYITSEIVHKTEAGVIALDVPDKDTLANEYERIVSNAKMHLGYDPKGSVLVQQKAPTGFELIFGVKRDPVFGHFLLFGLGGIFVEVFRDVAIRKMPVSSGSFLEMLAELKGNPILTGQRTGVALDSAVVEPLVSKLNHLIDTYPEIEELDLNPVVVSPNEAVICDVRIKIGDPIATVPSRPRNIEGLFSLINPESIAIIGASNQLRKNGGRLFRYIIENKFEGSVYPVHPTDDTIQGYKAYATVLDIPADVDLACIIVPAEGVLSVLQDCAKKGIHNVIVFSSGFSEVGSAGRVLQDEVCRFAEDNGINLIGPNSLGIISPKNHVYTAFGGVLESTQKRHGNIAFISQSGAIGSALLSRAWDLGVGFGRWVSVGNEADVTVSDIVRLFVEDEETKVIAIFMESIKDFLGFSDAARRAREKGKPIVVFKTGRTTLGQRAVQTHTGSIAGDDQIYDAVFRDLGILRVGDLQTLIDVCQALAVQPILSGNRIGIVTASGGACSILADLCEEYELVILQSESLESEVGQLIPSFGSAKNPIDVTAEIISHPEMFKKVLTAVIENSEVDGVIVMLTTNADPGASVVAEGILDIFQKHKKPIIVGRLGADSIAPHAMKIYKSHQFPVYSMPQQVVQVLSALIKWKKGEQLCIDGMPCGAPF